MLLVDDCPDTRAMYALALEIAGFRTREADNGLAAVESARAIRPAVVVLDYVMPILDGLEAARCMKRDPLTAAIPIILVSGNADECEGHGFAHVLTKPFLPEQLVNLIQDSLGVPQAAL